MKPFRVQDEILKEFEMYIYTTFPILDEKLKEQIKRKVREEKLLWKDPYITLDKNYVPGCTLNEAVENGIITEKTAEIFSKRGIERLYKHQELAIRKIKDGENVIVATGTGSGKTESFLIPIIDYIIRNPSEEGVKAIIVYPMNALANDQYSRLKDLLKGTKISFGIYTSATPTEEEKRPPSAIENERATREEIQKHPPDILITNYAMLEYLLIRKEDTKIFRHHNLKFIVMDEVHTYSGARGTEIAMLLRRVKEHTLGDRLHTRKIIHIGTSATIAEGEKEKSQVVAFAESFFGAEFHKDSIIFESHIMPEEPQNPKIPEPPELGEGDLQVDPSDAQAVAELAEKVLRIKLIGDVFEKLYDIIGEYKIAYLVEKYLMEDIYTLEELAQKIREDLPERRDVSIQDLVREIKAYLILGVAAIKDGKRRFRPKIHVFLRGIHGLVRCSKCGEVYPSGVEKCPKCGSLTFPLEVCRHCGKDYLRAEWKDMVEGSFLVPYEQFESNDSTYHLTKSLESIYPDEEITEQKAAKLYLCPSCGFVSREPLETCPHCGTEMEEFYYLQGKLTECPVCHGRYGSREVVTPLWSGIASDVSVVSTSLISNMEDNERRLLIFTDNRQDAAHQAGYMGDRHVKFTMRQLLYYIVKENEEKGEEPLDIDSMTEKIYQKGIEINLFDKPKTRAQIKDLKEGIKFRVIQEFTSVPRLRLTLESLGLLSVNYYNLEELVNDEDFKRIVERYHLNEDTLLKFLKIFLDEMRYKGAVNYHLFKKPLSKEDKEKYDITLPPFWKPSGFNFRKEEGSGYRIYPFISENGRSLFEVLTKKLLEIRDTQDFINYVVTLLLKHGYIVEEKIGGTSSNAKAYLVDFERMEIIIPKEIWICPSCTKIHTVNIDNKCTTYNCKGQLREYEPETEDYYVYHYTKHNPVTIKVAEHSGQISNEKRELYENNFRKGNLNVLVCTPTLELGIDIGDLSSILLRNVPPSPSNYAQRAGRAGRKTGIALAAAYTRGTPHDSYFYDHPKEIISGKIIPPIFNLSNEKIIRRHIRSFILEKIDFKMPSSLGEIVEKKISGSDVVYVIKNSVLDTLRKSISNNRASIKKGLKAVLEKDINNFDFLGEDTFEDYVDKIIDSFVDELKDTLKPLIKLLTNIRKRITMLDMKVRTPSENKELTRLNTLETKLLTDPKISYTYSYLSRIGFLPGYAFPGVQTQLIIPESPDPIVRDTEFAIREFAPGNYVYVDKMKYQPKFVIVTEEINAAEYISGHSGIHYKKCPNCDFVTSDTTLMYCPYCGAELGNTIHGFEPRMIKAENVDKISATEEYRKSTSFDVENYLIETKNEEPPKILLKGNLILQFMRNSKILITNKGKHGEGFKICLKCGSWTTMENVEQWEEYHKKYCDAKPDEIITSELSTIKTSDVALITVPQEVMVTIPDVKELGYHSDEEAKDAFLTTLLHTILTGLYIHMETSQEEVNGFIRHIMYEKENKELYQIILYETVPGGVGYIEKLKDYWCEIIYKAYETLYNHECDKACYRCLKNYYNQRDHSLLDKRLVKPLLDNIVGICNITIGHTLQSPQKDIVFDSPLEKEFYEIFERYNVPKPPADHYPIKDKEGRIIANADFAYPDQKIAIFVDGVQYHFSNLEQIQKLVDISNRLGILGWVVLRFPTGKIREHPGDVAKDILDALER